MKPKRFDWSKPVVKPAPITGNNTTRRLKCLNKAAPPSKHDQLPKQYQDFINKRRGIK